MEYEKLTVMSGLKLNAEKTEILRIINPRRHVRELNLRLTYTNTNFNITTKNEFKVNGIFLQQDLRTMVDRNVDKALTAMRQHLIKWSQRRLTLLGKTLIAKTFAVSQVPTILTILEPIQCSQGDIPHILQVNSLSNIY